MQSKIDWCDISYQPIVNDDDICGVYSYKYNPDKTMISYRSGGFELVYDGTPVFTTDICELGFSWLQSKYVSFSEFILDAVMEHGGQ